MFGSSTPGHTTSSLECHACHELELVRERHRLDQRDDLVAPIRPARPHEQAQVDLPRRLRHQPHGTASLAASSPELRGRQPLGALVGRMARCSTSAERARSRTPGGAPGASASDPAKRLAPVGEGVVNEPPHRGIDAGGPRSPPQPDQHRVHCGTGRNTVRATGRSTLTSHASWASTDGAPYAGVPGAAASRSPTSRWTMTTHDSHARAARRSCAGSRWPRSRRGGSRRRRRRRIERREIEIERVDQMHGHVVELRRADSRSAASRRRSTSTTCRCATSDASRADSTPCPPPISSTTSSPSSSASRSITSRMLRSTRKF